MDVGVVGDLLTSVAAARHSKHLHFLLIIIRNPTYHHTSSCPRSHRTSLYPLHILVLIAYPRSHFHLHPHPQPKSPYPRISGCLGHPGSSRQYKGSFKAPAPGLPDSRLPGVSKVSQSRSGSGLLHIVPSRMHSTPHSSHASKIPLCGRQSSCSRRILYLWLAASSARSPFEYQGQELQAPFSEG